MVVRDARTCLLSLLNKYFATERRLQISVQSASRLCSIGRRSIEQCNYNLFAAVSNLLGIQVRNLPKINSRVWRCIRPQHGYMFDYRRQEKIRTPPVLPPFNRLQCHFIPLFCDFIYISILCKIEICHQIL